MNAGDGELTDELRRLFADERLDLTPVPGAAQRIVAGARRVRRRRAGALTVAGAVAAVFAVGGATLLAGIPSDEGERLAVPELTTALPAQDRPEAAPTSATSTSKEPATPKPETGHAQEQTTVRTVRPMPPPASPRMPEPTSETVSSDIDAAAAVIGPASYGDLRLAMSFQEASDTGMLAGPGEAPPEGGCANYTLKEGEHAVFEVAISDAYGLAYFRINEAKTRQGVGVGTANDEVESTYPNHTADDKGYKVSAGSGGFYRFVTDESTVTAFYLVRTEQDCGSF